MLKVVVLGHDPMVETCATTIESCFLIQISDAFA